MKGTGRMNVVVTGGGTVAPIDEVRYISNLSSGRFSAAITEAWLRRGATVHHIFAPRAEQPYRRLARFDLDRPEDEAGAESARLQAVRRDYQAVRDCLRLLPLRIGTVADYTDTLERTLRTGAIDVAMLAMAVSDYEPEPVSGKIDSDQKNLVLRCRRTPKVIRSVRDWAPGVYLVGFKLTVGEIPEALIRRAEESCHTNRADLTIANDLGPLRQGRHTVHLVRPGQPAETFGPSPELADEVVARVAALAREARGLRP
jgi:phosphopantothenoylcysteine synthetase/decarboxylase